MCAAGGASESSWRGSFETCAESLLESAIARHAKVDDIWLATVLLRRVPFPATNAVATEPFSDSRVPLESDPHKDRDRLERVAQSMVVFFPALSIDAFARSAFF